MAAVSIGTKIGFGFFKGYKHVGDDIALPPVVERFSLKNHGLKYIKQDIESPQKIRPTIHVGFWDKIQIEN